MLGWESTLRSRFPAMRLGAYLDSAACGPLSLDVARAGVEVFESLLQQGGNGWREQVAGIEESRLALAALTGSDPDELAFTRNTSHGVALVAEMLWQQGRRTAVVLEDEFPASTLPLLHRGFDVRVVRPEQGRYRMADIAAALQGRDLLVASHVLYRTGQALDPAETTRLAHAAGALRVLCVTQSLGALQVDFAGSDADFLVSTSHKWLCGGFGTGLLAVKRSLWPQLRWPMAGWLSQRDPMSMRNDRLDLDERPRVLEMGSPPTPVLVAAGAAARLWLQTGPERVEARVRSLTRSLRERLRTAGFDAPDAPEAELGGITTVAVADAMATHERLLSMGVSCSPRGGGIRFGVHAFNNEGDLERAVEALREAV